jgi:hypothetical protein
MYAVDSRDTVVPLPNVPQSSVGAPCPIVLTDEHTLMIAYYLERRDPHWDGSYATIVDPATTGDPVALVTFDGYSAMMFGPPNDEAFEGHPLAARGLSPYGAYEIRDSSWIRTLERMNSVHEDHRPERYASLRHFVFAFHDSTFECVASSYAIAVEQGPLYRVIDSMKGQLALG